MTSYGEPQSYGRARPPGSGHDEYAYDSYESDRSAGSGYDRGGYDRGGYDHGGSHDGYGSDSYRGPDSYGSSGRNPDSYRRPSGRSGGSGRASVGSASVGSASVSPAAAGPAAVGGGAGRASVGRAGAGRASVGSASVGAASVGAASVASPEAPAHRYDWGGAGAQRPGGRASAPVSPGAVSARASVRPVSPGGPTGPGGPGGTGPDGSGPGRKKSRKRVWIRNALLSMLAVLIITTGGGMVALSYYVDSVPPPEQANLPEASTVLYSNSRHEIATLQEVNREIIDTKPENAPELANARNAVVAAEDNNFFEHSGVDFGGIMRAAFNNLTGGARQGASTIDQQYVGVAADIRGDASYSRKMQEAAMAYKLNQDNSKDEILDHYLNTVYFGRGAYGIQAAAQSYFGKDAAELSVAEAAVLAGTIKTPDDGSGLSPYDPLNNPENPQIAVDRWNYVLGQMVGMGTLTEAERAELEYPEVIEPQGAQDWHRGPQGNIVRQVRRELQELGITDIDTGGYKITTTIDRDIQKAARGSARRKGNDSPMWENIEDEVTAALVAVDPATGGVLAYYGGEDGVGWDNAGKNWNDADQRWEGGRAPGSSFKIYTLIAALREGVSLDTHWKTSEFDPGFGNPIRNAGRRSETTGCEGVAPDYCTLKWSTVESYNVPFFHYVQTSQEQGGSGAGGVVQAAKDAGITMMTGTSYEGDSPRIDIRDLSEVEDMSEVTRSPFDFHVAFGQYPVTVLDHANGVATLAAGGVYHKAHFVKQVEQRDRDTGEWVTVIGDQIKGEERIDRPIVDALSGVLTEVPGNNALADGRPAAAKTGTWEHDDGGNADAWMVGYTPQIATAVWVGREDNKPIRDVFGGDIGSSGLPSQIWKQFMDTAHAEKEWEIQQFPPAPQVGNPQHPYANGVLPAPDPDPEEEDEDRPDNNCRFGIFCDENNGNNGNNNGGNNGGGNGGNNGGGGNDGGQDGGGENQPPPGNDGGDDNGEEGLFPPGGNG